MNPRLAAALLCLLLAGCDRPQWKSRVYDQEVRERVFFECVDKVKPVDANMLTICAEQADSMSYRQEKKP